MRNGFNGGERKMVDGRLESVFQDLERTLIEFVRRHEVTHDEYRIATSTILEAVRQGEGSMIFDVFLEAETLDVDSSRRDGSPLGLLGPFHFEGAPRLEPPYVMPQRPDEKGERLVFRGTVRSTTGVALPDAEFDMWQADADGEYSLIHPGVPDWNLRGRFGAAAGGAFEVTTVLPAAYEIPQEGPTGATLRALGRHFFRPAHVHLRVTAPGHEVLTTQLYFEGEDYLTSDAANAVRDGLIVSVRPSVDALIATYDFALEPA
jgi:catechol 1,2-dioxygenase